MASEKQFRKCFTRPKQKITPFDYALSFSKVSNWRETGVVAANSMEVTPRKLNTEP